MDCHPDWVPSLHLGHTEVKTTNTERYSRRMRRHQATAQDSTVPAASPDLPSQTSDMDENAHAGVAAQSSAVDETGQGSEVDEAAPKSCVEEQQECRLCVLRIDEINHLLEENRILTEELSRKKNVRVILTR